MVDLYQYVLWSSTVPSVDALFHLEAVGLIPNKAMKPIHHKNSGFMLFYVARGN